MRALRVASVAVPILLLGSLGVSGQTAHYGGTFTQVGGGFNAPLGAAVDLNGNVFVADGGAVKEILAGTNGAANGTVSLGSTTVTIASGFGNLYGVALDANGNVFVTDNSNSTVNVIEAVGGQIPASPTVVTLGSGFNQPFGVAVDPSGDLFVADTYNSALKEFVAVGGQVSTGSTLLTLSNVTFSPGGVAVDSSGNVFLTDRGSGVWEIVAGTGGAPAGQVNSSSTLTQVGSGFLSTAGVAVDAAGDLFIADASPSANWVKEIVAVGGQVSMSSPVITRDGASGPFGVAVNAIGDVYATYSAYSAVEKIETAVTDFGTRSLGNSSLTELIPFQFDSGGTPSGWKIFTGGGQNLDFSEVTSGGPWVTTCSTSAAYSAGDECVVAVKFSPLRPGQRMGAVQLYDSGGNVIATARLNGVGSAPQVVFPGNNAAVAVGSGFNAPSDAAVDALGDVFVADTIHNVVKEIVAVNGQVSSSSQVNTVGSGFNQPRSVAVDGSGNVFVADSSNSAIKEIVAVNGIVTSASQVIMVGSGFNAPWAVAVDGHGNVFVADTYNQAIKEVVAVNGQVSASSTVVTLATTVTPSYAYPAGVAVDSSGNVFFADTNHSAVKEIVAVAGHVSSNSTVIAVGTGFSFPFNISTDALGNVFVADWNHNAVKEIVAVNGQVSAASPTVTVASGFTSPGGMGVGPDGNVFVADDSATGMRQLALATPPSLTFATTAVGSTSSDSPKAVAVRNGGNADLTFTAVSYPTDFPDSGNGTSPCVGTTVLSAGNQCDLSIDFSPLSAGAPFNENVTLTDNALNLAGSTQSVPVSGSTPVPPHLTSPAPSSTLSGPGITFTWDPGSATQFRFLVGSAPGWNNYFGSGLTSQTSVTVHHLPTGGATLYARLYYFLNGTWSFIDYTFTEAGTLTPPVLTTPTPSSTLTGASQTFTWQQGEGSALFQLQVGTLRPGTSDVYKSGWIPGTTAATLSASVPNLPTNGVSLYVTLFYRYNGVWSSIPYVYTESGSPGPPSMISPAPGATLTGSSQTFTWNPGGLATQFQLQVGTVLPGSGDVYKTGWISATSATAPTIPTNGADLYVTLWYRVSGVWKSIPYVYTESPGSGSTRAPSIINPVQNSTLSGSSQTFAWDPGAGVTSYILRAGTTRGGNDVYNGGITNGTSAIVNNIPSGGTLYVKLLFNIGGTWSSVDYSYTEP